ncbi:MAG: T9SS type A sorting domain-containing protein [Candidatus Eisenbacteria bacterium]|uniref:T9SS type A sorting domain-containing protein n=1 Tax=Eiseniibacteriota bacterium TaxID=2212470 RepID=A0A933W344_UNCEI|nr:T9SS type A sorting domain-containing protein [Candidatus Eisenbacteria bacterium]
MRLHRTLASSLLLAFAAPAFAATAAGPAVPAFVIDGGTRVTVKGATKLTMNCDLKNQGAFEPSAGSAVVMNGFLTPALTGVASFADLTIAKQSYASLGTNATVNGVLTLSSGQLSLAGHDLVAQNISGGSAASYVMTPDTLGRLVRTVGSFPSVVFPVGNASYDPVSVRTGTGVDDYRVAVMDAPPPNGLTPAVALTRAWAVSGSHAPGVNGDVRFSVQWNAGEQGASFDRSLGGSTSALAWRWNGTAWSPQTGVRRSDNGAYPAVDTLVSTLSGLWTLAGPGALLAADGDAAPAGLELAPVWPNPFRGAATLRYGVPKKMRVTIGVYSVQGQHVATLADGEREPGWHVARLQADRMANGVYFLRVQAGGEVRSSKLVVMR